MKDKSGKLWPSEDQAWPSLLSKSGFRPVGNLDSNRE